MSKAALLVVLATLALCHGAHIFTDSDCDTGYALGESSDQVDCMIGRLNNDTSLDCSSGCAVNYDDECTSGYTLINGDSGETVCWFGTKGTNINNYYDSSEVACGTGCQVIGDTDCGGGYAFTNGDDSECIDVYTRDDTSETLWWLKTNTVSFVPHEALTAHDVKQLANAKVTTAASKVATAASLVQAPTEGSTDGIGFNAVSREATIYLNYKEKDDARKAAKAAEKATTTTTTTKKAEEDVMAAADEDEAALVQVTSRVHRSASHEENLKTEHASKALDEKDGQKTKKKRSRTAMTLKKKFQKQLLIKQ